MSKSTTIRYILGSLLLGLFLLGITPRQLLHDLFTDHSHQVSVAGEYPQIGVKGFQCDSQSVVAKSPFVENDLALPGLVHIFTTPLHEESLRSRKPSSIFSSHKLRGPPAVS